MATTTAPRCRLQSRVPSYIGSEPAPLLKPARKRCMEDPSGRCKSTRRRTPSVDVKEHRQRPRPFRWRDGRVNVEGEAVLAHVRGKARCGVRAALPRDLGWPWGPVLKLIYCPAGKQAALLCLGYYVI